MELESRLLATASASVEKDSPTVFLSVAFYKVLRAQW